MLYIKKGLALVLLLFIFNCLADDDNPKFDFLRDDFEQFIERFCDKKELQNFCGFYNNLLEKISTLKIRKRKMFYHKVKAEAFCGLEIKHRRLYLLIKDFAQNTGSTTTLGLVHTFLIRYGMYELFLKEKVSHHKNVWFKVKSYFYGVRNTVRRNVRSFKGFISGRFQLN
ncbi:hypothetical protein HN446_05145 [bacterium]|nr:hypothetical protein [bacterium]